MKHFFEPFSKISNGILIGCFGVILICWGLYEVSDTMILIGLIPLVVGFILAVSNEHRVITQINDLTKSNKRTKDRAKELKSELEQLQDSFLELTDNLESATKELKLKNDTIERFKKIRVSMLQYKEK